MTFLGASDLPDGLTLELVSEEPNAIRAIPGLGVSPKEAPYLVVGKAILRLKSVSPKESPATTCTVNVRQRGVDYRLPLTIAVDVQQGLRAKPDRLLFSASRLDGLKRIKRKTIIYSDTKDGGRLEVLRRPLYLDINLARAQSPTLETTMTARVLSSPPTGSREDEIVLRNSRGTEITIPVYISYDP